MIKKYIMYHASGLRVDVVEAKADATQDVQLAVLGEKEFTKRPFGWYRDAELEALGFTKDAAVNASLFFNEGTQTYANGIEKAYGVVHENDDSAWDNNKGFYIQNGIPYIYNQSYIKTVINKPEIRGAITAAFGLLNNGAVDISGAKYGQPSRGIFLKKSGRTIVGKKSDNTIVLATFEGVTGVSGLTGDETVWLAIKLGLRNAVCMDGGGSTYLEYKNVIYNDSSREGPNAIAIYTRLKTPFAPGTRVRIDGVFTIDGIEENKAFIKELEGSVVDLKYLTKV